MLGLVSDTIFRLKSRITRFVILLGSMWTEHVDHTNLECRMWPRAGAIAARLWGYEANQPVLLTHPDSIGVGYNQRKLTNLNGIVIT
jgi:Glycosyl hydrolase family 20, catalytic domain